MKQEKIVGLVIEHEAEGLPSAVEPELQQYRSLGDLELARIRNLQKAGDELIAMILALGNTREMVLARAKAEEAVMWAIRGLTR
jgi:hypothetical protein